MDLRFSNAEASAEERDAVDRLLGAGESGWYGGERDEESNEFVHGALLAQRKPMLAVASRASSEDSIATRISTA